MKGVKGVKAGESAVRSPQSAAREEAALVFNSGYGPRTTDCGLALIHLPQ